MEVELFDLTQEQKDIKEDMIETTNRVGFCFMDSKYRMIGKTTILRDIGLEDQALGYNVFIVTSTLFKQEYIATRGIAPTDSNRYVPYNSIVLVDELYIGDTDWLVRWCAERKLPLMGFVRYVR